MIFPLLVGTVSGIAVFAIISHKSTKKEKQRKEDEELNIINNLATEVNFNQSQLQPLAECVDKVLDNDNNKYSKTESTPNKLIFETSVYDGWSKRIDSPRNEIKHNAIKYYLGITDIEEKYINLKFVHGESHNFLHHCMVDSKLKQDLGKFNYDANNPGYVEIEEFLRHTKEIYNLGAVLIKSMKSE